MKFSTENNMIKSFQSKTTNRSLQLDLLCPDYSQRAALRMHRVTANLVGANKEMSLTLRYLVLNQGFTIEEIAEILEIPENDAMSIFLYFRNKKFIKQSNIDRLLAALGVSKELMNLYIEAWVAQRERDPNLPVQLYVMDETGEPTQEVHWFSLGMLSKMFQSAKDITLYKVSGMQYAALNCFRDEVVLANAKETAFHDHAIYIAKGSDEVYGLKQARIERLNNGEPFKVLTNGSTTEPFDEVREIKGRVVWKSFYF